MTVKDLQCVGRDLFAPLAWYEFWIGIVTGAIAGVILFEFLLLTCK